MSKMQHTADGDMPLRLFPNEIDAVGKAIDSSQPVEWTAQPENLRHSGNQVHPRFDTPEKLMPEPRASCFIPQERFSQIGLRAARDGERVSHASGLAHNAPLHVFPRVPARGVRRVALRILSKNGIMPSGRFDSVGVARDLVPKLLDQEEFLGRRQSFDLSGERSVHGTEM